MYEIPNIHYTLNNLTCIPDLFTLRYKDSSSQDRNEMPQNPTITSSFRVLSMPVSHSCQFSGRRYSKPDRRKIWELPT
ncbi:UNVERIFIED_CONTAM: hypothetical protein PYX00_003249 [Menopon gallinae]|uniref:Uncharacterized protein n=1 Tax=Menopon gallinae TaxID=328185 RepID=A0AAW2I0V1_9NEOP